jgi:hypothetical protein
MIRNGPVIAATFEPALNIPVAKALSFFGNHSATLLMAAGKLPPSPRPSVILATTNPGVLPAKECAIAAMLHTTMEMPYPSLVPILSMKRPKSKRPKA